LVKISEILEVSPLEILGREATIVNVASNQGTQGIGYIEHFHSFQREFVEKMVASKDEEIDKLHKIIDGLLKDKEQMMDFFKRQ
jgi:hypothetical protein